MSVGKCKRHPRQVVVGVCAACLKERLLALMIEEEECEIARDSFASSGSLEASTYIEDSPPMYKVAGAYAHTCSDSSFNIFTDHCKASVASSAPRRHGMEYNREDVKHVASLYLQRHHSLSSSPLQKPTNLKVSALVPRQHDQEGRKSSASVYRDLADRKADEHLVVASTPRKKRGSLWSLLQRHGIESGSSSMRKDCDKVEQHRRSLQGNSTFYKSPYMNGAYIGGDQHKLSYAGSLNLNALDRSSRVNASSLNSSPRSFRSKHASGGTSSHMLSPAPSRHCTPLISPLQMKGELDRHVETKLLPGRRHSFAEDSIYDIADDEKLSKSYHASAMDGSRSWISSILFPSRGKSSKPLLSKGNDTHVYASHNPSRRQSVSASPELAPRRKSVSFLDEHVAARSPRTTRFKTSSPPKHRLSHDSVSIRDSNLQHSRPQGTPMQHGNGRGGYRLDIVGGDHEQSQKSPRMRMANFLTKRRNSMGMDCTRDMRVSPVPMASTEIRNPGSHAHRNLPFIMIEEDAEGDEAEKKYNGSLHTGTLRSSMHDKDMADARSSVIKLVPASMVDAEMEGVKQSSKTASQISMSKSKSWTSTWTKTLSPMLGLRGKKKKLQQKESTSSTHTNNNGIMESMNPLKHTSMGAVHDHDHISSINGMHSHSFKKTCNLLHHDHQQCRNFDNHHHHHVSVDCGSTDRSKHLIGRDSDSHSSSPASLLRKDHSASRSEGINAELRRLQLNTPTLSPNSMFAPNHKRPPQQYSFLSKDYSAFSFYFSPRNSSSSANQMISEQLRRINAADQLNPGAATPPRHSVDGTLPSLLKKPAAAGAPPLLAGAPYGR